MDYRINFFRKPESGTDNNPYCYSFIGKGTLNEALRHTKERLQNGHFLKADIWEQQDAVGGHDILRHTIKADEAEFIDAFITPTMDDIKASFRKPRQYEVMYPATDNEVREALQRFGGFASTDYQRIAHNVVIADGAIVVVLKPEPEDVQTLYVIDGQELPLQEYKYDSLNTKVWATPAVMADIRKAEETLLAQLRSNK